MALIAASVLATLACDKDPGDGPKNAGGHGGELSPGGAGKSGTSFGSAGAPASGGAVGPSTGGMDGALVGGMAGVATAANGGANTGPGGGPGNEGGRGASIAAGGAAGASHGGAGGSGAAGAGGALVGLIGAWSGVLGGGDQSGTFEWSASGASPAIDVSGFVRFAGVPAITVSGTYSLSTGTFALAGSTTQGAVTFTGSGSVSAIAGAYVGPAGKGMFSGLTALAGVDVSLYCGTYSGAATGPFNLAMVGNVLVGVTDSAHLLGGLGPDVATAGNVTGPVVTVTSPELPLAKPLATGVVGATAMQGTWNNGMGNSGTWAGAPCVATQPCNAVINAGPVVSRVPHMGVAPAMTGGAVADGTYVLTAIDEYGGAVAAETHQETWVVQGRTAQFVLASSDPAQPNGRVSATFTLAGTSLILFASCPSMVALSYGYSATANQIQLVYQGSNEVHTLTRQ